ncbi:Phenylalanine--tRNA ligase beta subunit [Poriferisphaera corsica]|uniref:Phenylalanine--tRNA ligase beta subunit n=1 Tax=Poriferisphaera corsica TaxID=2528020 RepID=A0A517YUB1_9BACT|nr:phenylalanine--tRNA ligase subunit beta [Poriferisphaera corsica]QDU33825.1 Phenylalanine--tRNA ligase beta subunit [Poriferisphaera corsica]
MKISLEWINAYLDRPAEKQEVVDVMTGVGFPEDGMEELADGDLMIDLEVTSNRSDCLSVVGLARELAAATGRKLMKPRIKLPKATAGEVSKLTSVSNEAHDLCPVYTARVIKGVKVGPSPQWIVKRLEAVGLRCINNVVDITNYVMLEMGQPLHAFDMKLLKEERIVVRRAKQGEKFVAIDDTKHELQDWMLVIGDAGRAVAVGGVMGGLESEVGDKTVDVLLEAGSFDALNVRKTSRKLKLSSDASFRYERGVDLKGLERASQRAAQLIIELAGGELAEGVIRAGDDEPSEHQVKMRVSRCNALLGTDLSADKMCDMLGNLELQPKLDGDTITCTIPTFRLDLHREVDLIEEVARHYGMDHIDVNDKIQIIIKPTQNKVKAKKTLGDTLVAHGYHETITYSYVTEKKGRLFLSDGEDALLLNEDMRKAEPMLRPSVVPSLLNSRKINQDLGNSGVKFFETASVWHKRGDAIQEKQTLTMMADAVDKSAALREMRGTIEEAIETLGGVSARETIMFEPCDGGKRYEVAATVKLGDKAIGEVGVLSGKIAKDGFDLQTDVVCSEIEVDAMIGLYPPVRNVGNLSRVPAIERDLSVVVTENVSWAAIEKVVLDSKPELLEDVQFIEVYRGKPIAKGSKSVSFRMLFRDPAKTLRHEQVDPQMELIMNKLANELKAEVRGS